MREFIILLIPCTMACVLFGFFFEFSSWTSMSSAVSLAFFFWCLGYGEIWLFITVSALAVFVLIFTDIVTNERVDSRIEDMGVVSLASCLFGVILKFTMFAISIVGRII